MSTTNKWVLTAFSPVWGWRLVWWFSWLMGLNPPDWPLFPIHSRAVSSVQMGVFLGRGISFSPGPKGMVMSAATKQYCEKNIYIVREFPGSPMVSTWHFHCQGLGSIPGQGTKLLQTAWCSQIKQKTNVVKSILKPNWSDVKSSTVLQSDLLASSHAWRFN